MFEIGWTEMLVIAIVMIVVVGPKDLPRMLRTFGKTTAKLRAMAGDFQKQFNEALKEAELDDVKKSVDSLRTLNPMAEIRKQLNPFEQAAADVRAGVDAALKPAHPAATEVTTAAEGGALEEQASPLPSGPTEMPAAPAFPTMSAEPPSPVAAPAAPLKAGPAVLPGEGASAPPAGTAAAGQSVATAQPPVTPAAPAAKVEAQVARAKPGASGEARAKPVAKAAPSGKAAAAKPVAKPTPASEAPAKRKPAAKPAAAKKNTAGTAK